MKKLLLICSFFIVGCEQSSKQEIDFPIRSFENRVGTVFTKLPDDLLKPPLLEQIHLPQQGGIDAIWGATGRDDEGNIYIGTSSHSSSYGSSFLYQYNPLTEQIIPQSDTVAQLKYNDVYRQGMRQNKLHSKFFQANDGYIYFSSFDEGGESKGINPTWGGNLWRKKPHSKNWEHLLATDEALVAINTNGRFVYALGYWDHVLYQFDIKTSRINRVVVGSVEEHVSRNFIVDELGHAYVPMLKTNDFNEIETYLNEYDEKLSQVASYPIPNYLSGNMTEHHGIIGYTSMKNGDVFFTSSEGGLYQIKPFVKGQNKLKYHGMMHPDGSAYIPSLFSTDGEGILIAIGRRNINGKLKQFERILYDVNSAIAINQPLNTYNLKSILLYGSLTKDNFGNAYIGGRHRIGQKQKYKPLLFKYK